VSEAFLDPHRRLPAEPGLRAPPRRPSAAAAARPTPPPPGHTDPAWFAENRPFGDAAALFLTPDHYVLRMLRSRGLSYDDLGVPRRDGGAVADPRSAWRLFAQHYHLFAGTPSRLWIDHSMNWAFGIDAPLGPDNADRYFDLIGERLGEESMRPLAILDKANVEAIATTEFALDELKHHAAMEGQGLIGRVRTTYRPDDVTDPDNPAFLDNLRRLGELTGQDVAGWDGLIAAHRPRRAHFRKHGATATDHGGPPARTADLGVGGEQAPPRRLVDGRPLGGGGGPLRAQMLTEMAALSVEDGMVMQIHAGSRRNTDPTLMAERGANLGADIPVPVDAVRGLQPLLARHGNATGLSLIFFCLDESTYARELAPMAGYWPALLLGPPWWFHASPRGIARSLDRGVETAGFQTLAGFNDDTRALLSIPARHDVWRRCAAAFLAGMVSQGLLGMTDARQVARWLAYDAAKAAYRLP